MLTYITLPQIRAVGEVALDGIGRNSPFTQAFLENVQASNDDPMLLFKGVIRDVMGATDGQQRPQMVSGMAIDFHFHGDTTVTVNPQLPEAQAAYDAAVKSAARPPTRRSSTVSRIPCRRCSRRRRSQRCRMTGLRRLPHPKKVRQSRRRRQAHQCLQRLPSPRRLVSRAAMRQRICQLMPIRG